MTTENTEMEWNGMSWKGKKGKVGKQKKKGQIQKVGEKEGMIMEENSLQRQFPIFNCICPDLACLMYFMDDPIRNMIT